MENKFAKNLEDLNRLLKIIEYDEEVASVLLFGADKNHPSKEELDPILKAFSKPLIGGIFPQIIIKGEQLDEGFLIMPLLFPMQTASFDLSESNDLFNNFENIFKPDFVKPLNLFVFIDAFAERKSDFIRILFDYFGVSVGYIGGGAGSLSFKPFHCILNNNGASVNSAVLGLFDADLKIGVAHGWSRISEPLKITKAIGKKIIEIDHTPAFEVYKRVVESHSGLKFTDDNFFDIAKSYPLGMVKLDGEPIIRDPYAVSGNSILIVDEIPEEEYVRVMNGNLESLLSGAKKAREKADLEDENIFCVDCISRVLYMGEKVGKELEIVKGNGRLDGILSIGEIANNGESLLEIYNKTIVAAKWMKQD